MKEALVTKVGVAVNRFTRWLEHHGEVSYDFQTVYASKLGQAAKALYYSRPLLGTIAVAPIVACEALMPSARRLFWKPQRFPIADAHYAMGFAFLARTSGKGRYYNRAVHFLEVLDQTRCLGFQEYCWGYPFDWATRTGTIKEGTPLITTIPYAYEAFSEVYAIDGKEKWSRILRSIAEHVSKSYRNWDKGPNSASSAYTPDPGDKGGIVNASAYRAFLLIRAARDFSEERYQEIGTKNLTFVLDAQNDDGSWYYAIDGVRDFIDHFHTCFVMKALAKIEQLTGCPRCRSALERGVGYYLKNLFDADGLPRPFSRAPRFTFYKRELYDYAECVNLALLLYGRFPELDGALLRAVTDILERWQLPDGSFRSRHLMLGWDNVPMHRWAQSQLFRSLCLLLSTFGKQPKAQRPVTQCSN